MKKTLHPPLHVNSVAELHQVLALPPPAQPLISLFELGDISCPAPTGVSGLVFGFYSIWLKQGAAGELRYGQGTYDFSRGTLLFLAPGQLLATQGHHHTGGWALAFHPALLHGHALAERVKQYAAFSYASQQALHLTAAEETVMAFLRQQLVQECTTADQFSPALVLGYLEVLLQYTNRFHQRQAPGEQPVASSVLTAFERELTAYFTTGLGSQHGLPTVKYLAGQLHLSPTYLSDLLRDLTGRNAQQHIQQALVAQAKNVLSTTALTVGEIAFLLGYEHAQSFSKMFHQQAGCSPQAFRLSLRQAV